MEIAKLSQKYQIVVPRDVRKKMKLHRGSRLGVYPVDGDRAILLKYPKNYVDAMQGLGKEVWHMLGGATRYIKQERASWIKKSVSIR
jgi:AbrB family looped-hinge helix DNA binding protein